MGEHSLGRGELQDRAVRGAVWTGIHTLVSLPLAFAVNILLARTLGVLDYGRLAYLTTVIEITAGIAGLGVVTALVQFGAKAHASGRTEDVKKYLSGAQGFRLLITGPIVAMAVLMLVDVEPWLMTLALIFGVLAPALLGTANDCLTIENRTDRSAQLAIVQNFILQASVVGVVLTLGTPDAVWSARVIAMGVLLLLPLLFISRAYRSAVFRPRPPWTLPRSFWAFALPTFAAGMIGSLAVSRTQILFLDWLSDPLSVGIFSLAFGLAGHIFAPAQALVGPLIPAVSGLSTVDPSAIQRAFLRVTRTASAIGGLIVASALPALACLVPLIYGADFTRASDLVVVLGVAGAASLIGSPHQAFLMARLAGHRLLWINIVALAANVILAVILIPHFGALGASISCAVAMLLRALQVTVGEAAAITLDFASLVRSLGGTFIATGIAATLWLGARVLPLDPVSVALIVGIIGIVSYVTLLKLTRSGITSDDSIAIQRALPASVRTAGGKALWLIRGD